MVEISNEVKEKNYNIFLKKLTNLGIDTEPIRERLGNKLLNATFSMNSDSGTAFDGSLIEVILKTLTVYAVKINELLPTEIQANVDSLVKVCLLHQISKAEMFIPNDNEWEVEKRGMIYKYAPSKVALKMGMKSLLLCQNMGIKFTDEEAEAMTILDRENNDDQAKFFATPLSIVLKTAANLTFLKTRLS